MTQQEIVQILTAATAILAVVIGPFVALRVAKRQSETALAVGSRQSATSMETATLQARTNVLSKNRQDWINTLRNEVSEFLVCTIHASTIAALVKGESRESSILDEMKEVLLHLSKARLLINPKEADHRLLIEKMEELYDGLTTPGYNFSSGELELTVLAQVVLKREWERVKSFT
jgi:vacuolar-type H+-ATPase subunit E/Vma4